MLYYGIIEDSLLEHDFKGDYGGKRCLTKNPYPTKIGSY